MNSTFSGAYFDGVSSRRHAVTVAAGEGHVVVSGDGLSLRIPLPDVLVVPPIGGDVHVLHLPGGAVVRTDSPPPEALNGARWERNVRALEKRWTAAIASVAFIAAFASLMFFWGLPTAARITAARMPDSVKREMTQQSLDVINRYACKKPRLPDARLNQVDELARKVTKGMPDWGRYGVVVRSCEFIGPNAFALPDGTILVTEQLILAMQSDEEIAAVLAHEVGHGRYDHPTRLALQSAGTAAVIAILGSDAMSVTTLAVALPTLLLESGYSRKFEEEADGFALERLPQIGISPARVADALLQMEKAHARDQEARGERAGEFDYLSTHPATAARIARARAAAGASKGQ
jgi:Zn-dependent protease with chaperone function